MCRRKGDIDMPGCCMAVVACRVVQAPPVSKNTCSDATPYAPVMFTGTTMASSSSFKSGEGEQVI